MQTTGLSLQIRKLGDEEDFIQRILQTVGQDPSFDVVETTITQFLTTKNISQWAIGDILVYIRKRSGFTPVLEVENTNGNIPEQVLEMVRDHYRVRLDTGVKGEFLYWTTLEFPRFMILQSQSTTAIWERNGSGLSDPDWDSYVETLSRRLSTILDGKTLHTYYQTSNYFLVRQRMIEERSWTWHYRATLLLNSRLGGTQVPHREKQIALGEIVEDLNNREIATVTGIKREHKFEKEQAQPFRWYMPFVEEIFYTNREGQKVLMVEFFPSC
ncbi:MAG: hypothetical protein GF334_05210, partial [Candidatus Altiarchaeales archaeon]|nr:hypothetical protein [Candidatus Altiarchaeales archaeon]